MAFLADRDVLCPGCGYNLRGLKGVACPECSRPVGLQVSGSDPVPRALIWTLVACSAGFGFSMPLLVYIVAMIAARGGVSGRPDWWDALPLILGAATGGVGVWLCAGKWRVLSNTGRRRQLGMAVAAWVVMIGLAAWFLLLVPR